MAVLAGMMSAIIRGKRRLSNIFAILLRSAGRLRASHINLSHSVPGGSADPRTLELHHSEITRRRGTWFKPCRYAACSLDLVSSRRFTTIRKGGTSDATLHGCTPERSRVDGGRGDVGAPEGPCGARETRRDLPQILV